jgi:hypothetical protein
MAFAFHNIYYINDLSAMIYTLSEPILFADYTSVIISTENLDDFYLMTVFSLM